MPIVKHLAAFGFSFALLVSGLTGVSAQEMTPMLPREQAATVPPSSSFNASGQQSPFLGSVVGEKPSATALDLSLSSAVERGLRSNLGALLAHHSQETAEGQRWLSRSGLLPNVTTRTGETLQQINLAAFGFPPLPGIPSQIIGPFAIFDTRISASQSIFDWGSIANAHAGSENLRSADLSYANARDIVVMVATSLYLQAGSGQSRIEAAEARVKSAQAIYDQAVDMKQAGVIPAIDALRAQVELQATQQQLIFYRNEFEKSKLNLSRAVGIPEAQEIRLTDPVPYAPLPTLTQDAALQRAFDSRADYKSALSGVKAAEYQKAATEAKRLPTLTANADFGDLGRRISSSHETFSASASLNIPLFQAGRVKGQVIEADAELARRRSEMDSLRGQIEHEVRTAFLDLKASEERVMVAQSAISLAQQQLEQSRDRFGAGVTNNLEVVQSQESLATAQENLISSTLSFNLAKVALARAMGDAEHNYRAFLLGGTQ